MVLGEKDQVFLVDPRESRLMDHIGIGHFKHPVAGKIGNEEIGFQYFFFDLFVNVVSRPYLVDADARDSQRFTSIPDRLVYSVEFLGKRHGNKSPGHISSSLGAAEK